MDRACSSVAASARRSHEAPPPRGAEPRFDPHVRCSAWSGLLSRTLCERLVRHPARRVPANQFLYFMGAPARRLYILKGGLVKTSRTSPAGDEMLLQLHQPGDILGESDAEGTHIVHYVRQEELAQMIAARREVVSALLNRLRADGLIDYSRKGRISVRRPALERYLLSRTAET